MISGNCNRSPQYAAMGTGGQRHANQYPFAQQQQQHQHQQQPQLLFMAGGSVRGFPPMSRGFSMMPNGGPLRPTVVQCDVQQGFGGGYGYSANSAPIFQQHQQPHPHYQHQPQVIHHLPPQQHYIQQSYISPPPAASTAPTSGFINGIKNMVKGFIHPLNCDFYNDHHKYYNPKYRNNYMRDITADKMSYVPTQPEPHLQAVMIGLEVGNQSTGRKLSTKVPKPSEATVPRNSPPKTTEVVAIFTSEDFPELPAPRSNRSITPAKTEKTIPEEVQKEIVVAQKKLSPSPAAPAAEAAVTTASTAPSMHPKRESIFFEIKCRTTPSGRRPTFGGRLKVVPPPFSLNKSRRTCGTRRQESTNTTHEDCDTEDDSFLIFPTERPSDCLFTSFGVCVPRRQRQISECSDDSFVVFCAEDADGLVPLDSDVDDDDEDDDDDDEDDDDDDLDSDEETSSEEDDSDTESEEEMDNGTDVVDSSFLGRNKTDRNKCAGATLLDGVDACGGADYVQLDSGFDEKKVTFNPHPVVHVMHTWNFAYRAARKGHWEDFARDRTRFQKRIERTAVYLNPILTPEHREKVYRSRFCDDADNQPQKVVQQHPNIKLDTRSPQATVGRSDDNQRLPKLTKTPQCARF